MRLYASWVHGNALTVETPENLAGVGHFGWGAVRHRQKSEPGRIAYPTIKAIR
jgi:hypothetical protein